MEHAKNDCPEVKSFVTTEKQKFFEKLAWKYSKKHKEIE